MQRLEVSGAVRPIYGSLGTKGLTILFQLYRLCSSNKYDNYVHYTNNVNECLRCIDALHLDIPLLTLDHIMCKHCSEVRNRCSKHNPMCTERLTIDLQNYV
jgi:hypothetical protein